MHFIVCLLTSRVALEHFPARAAIFIDSAISGGLWGVLLVASSPNMSRYGMSRSPKNAEYRQFICLVICCSSETKIGVLTLKRISFQGWKTKSSGNLRFIVWSQHELLILLYIIKSSFIEFYLHRHLMVEMVLNG